MTTYVVDENVAIVANDTHSIANGLGPKAPQADDRCRAACVKALRLVVKHGIVVVDDAGDILARYRQHLRGKGQPGIGDAFLKHVFDRQYDRRKVQRIVLKKNAERIFELFPNDPALATFDHADRLFVALALGAAGNAKILNAVDSDYVHHADALIRHGVSVKELCRNCVKPSLRRTA